MQLYAHLSDMDAPLAERRRDDAVVSLSRVGPFATASHPRRGDEATYLRGTSERAIVGFARRGMLPTDLYTARPGFLWGTTPTVEVDVETFVGLVCRQVVGHPATAAGTTTADAREDRVLGVIRTTDPGMPGLTRAGELLGPGLEQECGASVAMDVTYDRCCYSIDASEPDDPGPTEDVLRLREAGVTTVLIPGGEPSGHVRAAESVGYQPEWIILGDGENDGWFNVEYGQKETAYANRAFLVSDLDLLRAEGGECDPPEGGAPLPCCEYFLSPQFRADWSSLEVDAACEFYDVLRLMFSSLQTAGPTLHPRILERGLRSADQAPHPDSGAHCSFGPTRHTCIDDALLLWWDPTGGPVPGRQTLGCWRAGYGEQRFTARTWPGRDVAEVRDTVGDCSRYVGGGLLDA